MTRIARGILVVVSCVVVALGCGGRQPGGTAAPSIGPSATGPGESGSAKPSVVASLPAGEFQNPVIGRNFADPFVLEAGGTYYAYATGNLTYNIQVSTSTDLVHWDRIREALPRLPLWQPTSKGLTWAPEVVEVDGRFVMHYTARDVQAGRQCLAVAVATDPAGPFVDESDAPLLCQYDLGGSIDSSPFLDDDGTRYLLWKSDGNCCGIPVRMFIAELGPDGASLTTEPTDLGLGVDAPWERHLIEAPTLLLHDGTYYLFFSANDYNSRNYATGYATATEVIGPYEDAAENPILSSVPPVGESGQPAGPGHQSVFADAAGDLWMAYHAWDSGLVGDQVGGRRALWLDELRFVDGKPVVDGPDAGPQPAPAVR
jgi:beta-xylosidase